MLVLFNGDTYAARLACTVSTYVVDQHCVFQQLFIPRSPGGQALHKVAYLSCTFCKENDHVHPRQHALPPDLTLRLPWVFRNG